METTQIEPQKTAGEITAELVKAGATSVNTDYRDGRISGLRWVLNVSGTDRVFDMPARIDPVFKLINGRRSYPAGYADQDREQAERIAWRQLLRWVQAQLAMIDTGMVQAHEVFMPYVVIAPDGQTLFQRMEATHFKMLEGPKQ
jgi:hypothetical protein